MHKLLADLIVLLHLAFVLFAVLGGLLALRHRGWLLLHLPALAWAAAVEFWGLTCPLTPLENLFRARAALTTYQTGWVEHYLLPVLYPEGLTRPIQIGLGLAVLVINGAVYLRLWQSRQDDGQWRQLVSLPNLISLGRLAMVPVLLLTAQAGQQGLFLLLLTLTLTSDAVDGWLARRLGLCSPLGATLDSWADLAVLAGTPLAVWWLWPEVIRQERLALISAGLALALPLIVGLGKFGRLTSYHTRGAKLAAVLLAIATLLLLLDLAAWPFRLAVIVLVAAECEEIAITLTLPAWRADVPSLTQALRLRRQGHSSPHS